jgi:hypothetical protein
VEGQSRTGTGRWNDRMLEEQVEGGTDGGWERFVVGLAGGKIGW